MQKKTRPYTQVSLKGIVSVENFIHATSIVQSSKCKNPYVSSCYFLGFSYENIYITRIFHRVYSSRVVYIDIGDICYIQIIHMCNLSIKVTFRTW